MQLEPEQAPPQATSVPVPCTVGEAVDGEPVGVRLTEVPERKFALHVPELEVHAKIPDGVESTWPDPGTLTVSVD